MYGYVIPDKPNMFMKDYAEYRAYYCGICKTIGHRYGQLPRFLTSYDVTFLSLLLHAVNGQRPEIKTEACVLSPLKKQIAKRDALSELAVDINIILAHYKADDDKADKSSVFKRIAAKILLARRYKKAKRLHPALDESMKGRFAELARLEKDNCKSVDMASHPFANVMRDIAKYAFDDKFTDNIGDMMYNLGKWIYIVDAVDDIEDDYKRKNYNVFLEESFTDKKNFLKDNEKELEFILMSTYNRINECFKNIETPVSEGVITNIIWYGLLERGREILRGATCKKTRI